MWPVNSSGFTITNNCVRRLGYNIFDSEPRTHVSIGERTIFSALFGVLPLAIGCFKNLVHKRSFNFQRDVTPRRPCDRDKPRLDLTS